MSEKSHNDAVKAESSFIKGGQLDEVEVNAKGGGIGRNQYQARSLRESIEMNRNDVITGNARLSSMTPFYYDQQLRDRRLVVTLHPNAKYAGKTWVPFDSSECFTHNILNKGSEYNEKYMYRIKPIATAIASEDFLVNVSNSWTDFGRNNPIEDMYNSIKPYASMAKAAIPAADAIANYDYSKSSSSLVKGIGKFINKISELTKSAGLEGGVDHLTDILNRQLVVQGTRFSYYSGSTTSFGNLSMKFTVFSDWIWNGTEYAFTTCYEQLEELYDYAMCKYEDVNGSLFGAGAEMIGTAAFDSKTGKDVGNVAKNFIEENFKWQMPPGGFRADLKSIDNIQRGTLKLRINDMYTLENLVITSMNVAYSRIPCKCPLEGDSGKIVPLYADVTLSLQPATLYSDTALKAFSEGRLLSEVDKSEKQRKEDAEAAAMATHGDIWQKLMEERVGISDKKDKDK